mmetsp:Transcript_6434/g.15751  ORF Transcript_6434/g.15751 Transcript_6434/m.15751 type:complete len:241 (-) Transcript_6434:291-1013(-)
MRQAPRPGDDHHPGRRRQHERRGGALRGSQALRCALRRARRAQEQGAQPRRGGEPHAPRSVLAHRGRDRAPAQASVVGQLRAHGQARHRGRPHRAAQDHARLPRGHVVPVARQHPGLVRLAAAVVGASHPRVVPAAQDSGRRQLGRSGRAHCGAQRGGGAGQGARGRGARARPRQRRGGALPGRGRAGHVVLVRPLPILAPGLARLERPGHEGRVAPDHPARDGARHPLLLGGTHDDDGH